MCSLEVPYWVDGSEPTQLTYLFVKRIYIFLEALTFYESSDRNNLLNRSWHYCVAMIHFSIFFTAGHFKLNVTNKKDKIVRRCLQDNLVRSRIFDRDTWTSEVIWLVVNKSLFLSRFFRHSLPIYLTFPSDSY